MPPNFPSGVEADLINEDMESLRSGLAIRRRVLVQCGLILGALLVVLALASVSNALTIAVTVAVASLCIIYATMTLAASFYRQMDCLTRIVVHYAEQEGHS